MTDLHTHILPGMDDGAPDIKTALRMLAIETKQGVTAVALTPHFYRSREHLSDFLSRRSNAAKRMETVLENVKHPKLILAAEVAYVPGMADWEELEQLCYAGTKNLLVEPPMTPWNDEMFRQLYALEGRRGITPMIAHFDRYFGVQPKARIEQLLEMGFPIQISTASLLHFRWRGKSLKMLNDYYALPVSDCHNITDRPPNMANAVQMLEKKLGGKAAAILRQTDEFWQQ